MKKLTYATGKLLNTPQSVTDNSTSATTAKKMQNIMFWRLTRLLTIPCGVLGDADVGDLRRSDGLVSSVERSGPIDLTVGDRLERRRVVRFIQPPDAAW